MHVLFADGAVNQVLRRLLHEIEHDGSLAEADAFISDERRSPAPAIPAAIGSAHHAGITTTISNRHRSVTAFHREVIVHQKIGSPGVADLIEALGGKRPLNGGLHALANHFVVGICFALYGFAAGDHIARNHGT